MPTKREIRDKCQLLRKLAGWRGAAKRSPRGGEFAVETTKGIFRAILCWDQDRFGRFDSIEAGEWVSPLRRAGVELTTVCQGRIDWDDFAGRLIYQITQEGKHRFLVDLSRNSLRGMIRFAKQGNLLGMPTPYGYDRLYFNSSGEEMCRIRRGEKFHKPRETCRRARVRDRLRCREWLVLCHS